MVKILNAPSLVLSQKTKDYDFKDKSLPKLLKDMESALDSATDPKGVGLAAPQIGKAISVFIAKPSEKGKVWVFVNPVIKSREKLVVKSIKKSKGHRKLEGCLSLKDIWGEVMRPNWVSLSYFDENGATHNKKFKGFLSTIVQHEVDHLNGVLFPKHVLEQKGQLYHSSKDEKGIDIFEPIEI